MTTPIRALIVDDEPLARRALRVLLEGEEPVLIVGEAASPVGGQPDKRGV